MDGIKWANPLMEFKNNLGVHSKKCSLLGRVRSFFSSVSLFFWPIGEGESAKVRLMLGMAFCIYFNYNLLRSIKDVLLVNMSDAGAETLSFVKTLILIASFIFVSWFMNVSSRWSWHALFFRITCGFGLFFFLFASVLYPFQDHLHAPWLEVKAMEVLPVGMRGMVVLFSNWTYTLFYIASEMWGVLMLQLLFWGFANEISSLEESKRFYSLFSFSGQTSGFISGPISALSSSFFLHFNPFPFAEPWSQSLIAMMTIVCWVCVIILFLFHKIESLFGSTQSLQLQNENSHQNSEHEKKKEGNFLKRFIRDIKFVMQSPHLVYVLILILAYNATINISEILWKHELKKACASNKSVYHSVMGIVTLCTSAYASLAALFGAGPSIRHWGWRFAALVTPVLFCCTFLPFISIKLWPVLGISLGGSWCLTLLGAFNNCFARGSKYTFFDNTKDMALIPLASGDKRKGKAAIDGLGSRLGKALGSWILMPGVIFAQSLDRLVPLLGVLISVICFLWILSILRLNERLKSIGMKSRGLRETTEEEMSIASS